MQTLTAALHHNLTNYANFRGRTDQRDYWLFMLSALLLTLAFWAPSFYTTGLLRTLLLALPVVLLALPVLAATTRRFRDAARPRATYTRLGHAVGANLLHLALVVGLLALSLPAATWISPNTGDSTWGGLGALLVWLFFTLPIAIVIAAITFVPVVLMYVRAGRVPATQSATDAVPGVIAAPAAAPAEPVHPSLAVAAPNQPLPVVGTASQTQPAEFSALAILALVAAIIGFLTFGPLAGLGVIFGILALPRIRKNNLRGLTLAYLGIGLGGILCALSLIAWLAELSA